ncbi:MAG: S8 family serine peptidase [Sphingobacteriaceae bacterium]
MRIARFYRFILFSASALLFLTVDVSAQKELVSAANRRALIDYSQILKRNFDESRNLAFHIANQKGWPTFRIEKDGTVISLQRINSLGIPVYLKTFNDIAAATTLTTAVYTGGSLGVNLSGSSAFIKGRLGIWDGGKIYVAHQEFTGKNVSMMDNASVLSDHATHVTGTLIARGLNKAARGMSFGASGLVAFDFNNDASEMSKEAPALLVSNHSYGFPAGWDYNDTDNRWEWYGLPGDQEDYNFGYYDQTAQQFDKIMYNAPYYLIVKAAGNSRTDNGPAIGQVYYGYQSRTDGSLVIKGPRPGGNAAISDNNSFDVIGTTGTAKNILTIGAVNPLPFGPAQPSDVQIADFSAWGPTDDGRIKPDICGMGVNVLSTGFSNPGSYFSLSGTSMSSANVSGSVLLLQEYYALGNQGAFMRAATLKGLVCQTAFDAGNPGPDYVFGWGLLDMQKAAQHIKDKGLKTLLNENVLAQGEVQVINVTASGNGPLVAGISWTDPEGTVSAEGTLNERNPKLVNDLDIRISDGKNDFLPWVLDPAKPGAPATPGNNVLDNQEQIYLSDPIPGTNYTIYISHKNTLSRGPQAYSLIVSGIGGKLYCASAARIATGSKIVALKLAEVNFNAAEGCTGYINNTNLTAQIEAGVTYPFSITLGTCGTSADKIAKVFVDWNGDADFEDAGEVVAVSAVIRGNETFTGNITVPSTGRPGDFTRMRVVLTETTDASVVKACGIYELGETQDYTLKFLRAANDAGVTSIISPQISGTCPNDQQIVAVRIRNFGSKPIMNVPVSVTIRSSTTETKLDEVYKGIINPGKEEDFNLAGTFNAIGGAQYSIVAAVHLADDTMIDNNEISADIVINNSPVLNNATATTCLGGNFLLKGSGDGTIFWYKAVTDTIPFAFGDTISTAIAPLSDQYYAGLNYFSGSIGPVSKNNFRSGGYNQFDPGIKVTTALPLMIKQARLYIGNSGKITFSVSNANGEIVSSVTLNVVATRKVPGQIADDPTDLGQVFPLNLVFPKGGDYVINIAYADGATIYRNDGGVAGYPFSIGDFFSITGNTASNNESALYYYLYDLKVGSIGCAARNRIAVTVIKPLITLNGPNLSSNYTSGNQWYFQNTRILGATQQQFFPTQGEGSYYVEIQDEQGCVARSAEIIFTPGANRGNSEETELKAYPVPATTILTVELPVPKLVGVTVSLVNMLGQKVYEQKWGHITGMFKSSITVGSLPEGNYVLLVKAGTKFYNRKVTVGK